MEITNSTSGDVEESAVDVSEATVQQFSELVDGMRESMVSVRRVVQSLQEKKDTPELDTKSGISLLWGFPDRKNASFTVI